MSGGDECNSANYVVLQGRISQVGSLKYTPSGVPTLQIVLAALQECFGHEEYGYFEVLGIGDITRALSDTRVGLRVKVTGRLWRRRFRDRNGTTIEDTKIIIKEFDKLEDK